MCNACLFELLALPEQELERQQLCAAVGRCGARRCWWRGSLMRGRVVIAGRGGVRAGQPARTRATWARFCGVWWFD